MAEYIITQDDLNKGNSYLKTIYVSEGFDKSILDGKIPSGATIEVKREELITLSQLKAYDEEKTNIWHNSFTTNNLTVNGNVFTHMGFDVASTNIIDEDAYNNLGDAARNDAFYVTSPNGNMYFMGAKWVPSYVPYYLIAYAYLPNMANNMNTLTTSTLTFTSGSVTNSFVNGGEYSTIYKKTPFGLTMDMSCPVGTQANNGSILTNANELYIVNASRMYYNCQNLTDTFICNPSLITNAPSDYDPMKYCIGMSETFYGCKNFNQPVNIPNSVTSLSGTFNGCKNFNQPVNIPNSVTSLSGTFDGCNNFNQPVNIPNSVTSLSGTFRGCYNFNQPVNIPNSVKTMYDTFQLCYNFNQPVNIPNSVTSLSGTFYGCNNFNQPVNIPNSVTSLSGTFWGCYNFNQPVNIPNSVTNMIGTFQRCNNFNQPVNIPNSVTTIGNMLSECYNFNQPVTFGNNVKNMVNTFINCYNFNQPVNIPNSVIGMGSTFSHCHRFNQPVSIPDSVINLSQAFSGCNTLRDSTVPIHISHTIALGNTRNYIYNCLVNNYTGISFAPSRILNDL